MTIGCTQLIEELNRLACTRIVEGWYDCLEAVRATFHAYQLLDQHVEPSERKGLNGCWYDDIARGMECVQIEYG